MVLGTAVKGSKHLEARDSTPQIILKLIEGHSNADRTEMTFYDHKTIYSCSAGGMTATTLEVQGATKPEASWLMSYRKITAIRESSPSQGPAVPIRLVPGYLCVAA